MEKEITNSKRERQKKLLRDSARFLADGFIWLFVALFALIASITGAITSIIALIAGILAQILKLATKFIKDASAIIINAVVWILAIGSPVASIAVTFGKLYNALGGGFDGILATSALLIYPPVVVMAFDWGRGGLFLSSLAILALGYGLPVLSAPIRMLVVTGIIASIVISQIKGENQEQGEKIE